MRRSVRGGVVLSGVRRQLPIDGDVSRGAGADVELCALSELDVVALRVAYVGVCRDEVKVNGAGSYLGCVPEVWKSFLESELWSRGIARVDSHEVVREAMSREADRGNTFVARQEFRRLMAIRRRLERDSREWRSRKERGCPAASAEARRLGSEMSAYKRWGMR